MLKKNKNIKVKAPGKLFIAGEYAVVEGGLAILLAVNHYLTVELRESFGTGHLISSLRPDLELSWTRRKGEINFANSHPYNLVQSAMQTAEDYLSEKGDLSESFYTLRISSDLDHVASGVKYGLGSSGAVTVAVIKAVLSYFGLRPDSLLLYKLAVLAQLRLRFKGSFGDLAASSFGGWLTYRRPNRKWLLEAVGKQSIKQLVEQEWPSLIIERLELPQGLELIVGWTRSASSTEQLLARMKAQSQSADSAQNHQQFLLKSQTCMEDLITAFQLGDISAVQAGIRQNRKLLQDYGEQLGLLIETPDLVNLIELAEAQGAAAKSSGAGGGDCGICLANQVEQVEAIRQAWRKAGIFPLDLQVAPTLDAQNQERNFHDPAESQGPAHWTGQSAVSRPVRP